MSTLKQQIEAAEQRHRLRVAALADDRWNFDRAGLIKGSLALMEQEIAAIRRAHANDKYLSRCAGRESEFDPTASTPQTMEKQNVHH